MLASIDAIKWFEKFMDFPALILLMIFFMGGWVMWKTQMNPDNHFDFADMLRDETCKPSALRLSIFVSLGISSWAIMYMLVTNKGTIDIWALIAYMAIWSGAKVAEKFIDAYAARTGGTGTVPAPKPIAPQPKLPIVEDSNPKG